MNRYNAKLFPGQVLCILLLVLPVAGYTADSPRDVIKGITEKVVHALEQRRTSITNNRAEAFELVEEIILPHVDFQRIGKWVLGKYWRRANVEQRAKFIQEFRALLMHTYVNAMVEYVDQIISYAPKVDYLQVRSNPDDNDVKVRTDIHLENHLRIPVNYSLHLSGNHWKIYDVTIDGISLAVTYRNSFASEIRRAGLDTLISRLSEKNQQNAIKVKLH